MRKRKWTDQQLTEAVSTGKSIADVLRDLGLSPVGGSYRTIKIHCQRLSLDISHFDGKAWSKGTKRPGTGPGKLSDEQIFTSPSKAQRGAVKNRLLALGVPYKCYRCGLSEWMDSPISLQLEHVNGDPFDNRRDNLCLLCPNCHSQTPTFAGRNIKQARVGELADPLVSNTSSL